MAIEFSREEKERIYQLAEKLTGTCQDGRFRHSVLVANVGRRMQALDIKDLDPYIKYALEKRDEYERLVSSLTIHTTAWFREAPHYERLEQDLAANPDKYKNKKFRVLSAACSTGEEVYSFALVMEQFRDKIEGFDYEIVGMDIDSVSVKKARDGIYDITAAGAIPQKYRRFLLKGEGENEGLFTAGREIKSRCTFKTGNLKNVKILGGGSYDLVVCRNVLIYFSATDVDRIVKQLIDILNPEGVICLGHSEALESQKYELVSLGNSCYSPVEKPQQPSISINAQPPRVLVVEDSPTMRAMLKGLLSKASFDVTVAESAEQASKSIRDKSFDIITLDLHMPGESGQKWLEKQRRSGLRVPILIFSGAAPEEAVQVLGALENGAQDYLDKCLLHQDSSELVDRVRELSVQYRAVIRGAHQKKSVDSGKFRAEHPDLILLGASTGGTEVLARILRHMPSNTPPVVVAQHITPNFAEPFAKRLSEVSGLKLGEIRQGEGLQRGHIYLALDDYHVGVARQGGRLILAVSHEAHVNRHRPSVDFLFKSGASLDKTKILAMLLTGMGADGARGLLALKDKGAITLVQDEGSCVVYGMPREAVKLGAAMYCGDPDDLKMKLLTSVSTMPRLARPDSESRPA